MTVLYRIAGAETPGEKPGVNKTPFTDVEDGTYYTNAINWAYETGRIAGYQAKDGGPSTAFGPNDPVTREQLAVFVWRAAGEPAASDEVGYLACKDAGDESSYATAALKWAASAGVLTGSSEADGLYLRPAATTQRCQGAKVFVIAQPLLQDAEQ